MNREQAIRTGLYEAIKTGLSYNGQDVHVYDSETQGQQDLLYVLLTDQTANENFNNAKYTWKCTITIEIISKQVTSASKDITDNVGDQIETKLCDFTRGPGSRINGLVAQDGWSFHNIYLDNVAYAQFGLENQYTEVTKIMTFNIDVTKIV